MPRVPSPRLIFLFVATVALSAPAQEADFTAALASPDFEAAGLHKLTPQERTALDRLVADHVARTRTRSAATAPGVVSADTASVPLQARVARPSDQPKPRRIEARLVGRFTGWTGGTIFELSNGQRWLQVDGDSYQAYPAVDTPEVQLTPAVSGTYLLKVEGYGKRCRVKLLDG